MTCSLDRIDEILSVESAALPATDNWTTLGNGGANQLVGNYTFSDGSWPLFSSWVTWTDITLLADAGDDTLDGQAGNDRLYPGPGDDAVLGGSGTDAVAFVDSLGPVTVDLASGFANEAGGDLDTVSDVENVLGSEGGDHIYGDGGPNVLDGWEGDDSIYGRAGVDDLRGGDGHADTILDGEGNDTLKGGAGDDTLLADSGDDVLEVGAGTRAPPRTRSGPAGTTCRASRT
jgi:Ca2+-binding RTX toxin-like protein